MINCKCSAGSPAPASQYNKASSCQQDICSLHTIVIPKNKGSDAPGEPYAPQNGSYQNAIVVYEATGAVYIFDEKGIMTNLTGSELVRMVEQLQQQVQTLSEQTEQNTTAISTETQNRLNAQTQLQTALDALQTALTAEQNARTAADTALNDDIVALQERVSTNTANIVTETTNRTDADANLQAQITANANAIAAETQNRENSQTTTDTNVADLQEAVENLSTKIDDSLGKVTNLPDSLVQGTVLNSSTENNNVTMQSSTLNLGTGDSNTDTQTVQFKTVGGQSIIGEGDIPASGGGSTVEVVQTTGTSTTAVMSQNAVTEIAGTKQDNIEIVSFARTDTTNYIYTGDVVPNSSYIGPLGMYPIGETSSIAATWRLEISGKNSTGNNTGIHFVSDHIPFTSYGNSGSFNSSVMWETSASDASIQLQFKSLGASGAQPTIFVNANENIRFLRIPLSS